ncbi:MAG TPA: hypothetical protein VNK67_14630 [Burkholderiales bacterium]|nr:hypothetical protein [Burkholderiales bacterium]
MTARPRPRPLGRPHWKRFSALLLPLLAACATPATDTFVRDDIITEPTPSLFSVCHGRGCAVVSQVALSPEQWQRITAVFSPPPGDSAAERERIARAIAAFETVVGELTGTADDRPGNESGGHWSSQMDCIDESTNTTSYLRMLLRAGLLRWHAVEPRATRGYFLFGWPHTTAVVRDTAGGELWAVDSFYFENGQPPVIVPLKQWRAGWRPPKPLAARGDGTADKSR